MSFQANMNGGQAAKAFKEYNVYAGSAVVDLSREYNTGNSYSTRIGTGNQIDLAFKEINAHEGKEIFSLDHPDYGDGNSLHNSFIKLAILVKANGPIWGNVPDQVMLQTEAWPITDLDTYTVGSATITYTVTTGALPTGITLNTDGTFTGTATNVSAGTVAFTATNSNGANESNWIAWEVN